MIAAVWASPQVTQTNRTKLVTLWDCDPESYKPRHLCRIKENVWKKS